MHAALQNIPNVLDLASDAHQKGLMRLILAPQAMTRPFAGVAADRSKAPRDVFAATREDPAPLAEAKNLQISIGLMSDDAIPGFLAEFCQAPKEIAARAGKAFGLQ